MNNKRTIVSHEHGRHESLQPDCQSMGEARTMQLLWLLLPSFYAWSRQGTHAQESADYLESLLTCESDSQAGEIVDERIYIYRWPCGWIGGTCCWQKTFNSAWLAGIGCVRVCVCLCARGELKNVQVIRPPIIKNTYSGIWCAEPH